MQDVAFRPFQGNILQRVAVARNKEKHGFNRVFFRYRMRFFRAPEKGNRRTRYSIATDITTARILLRRHFGFESRDTAHRLLVVLFHLFEQRSDIVAVFLSASQNLGNRHDRRIEFCKRQIHAYAFQGMGGAKRFGKISFLQAIA